MAEARLYRYHPGSQEGTWVAEHLIYLNDKQADILVVDKAHSQLLKHPAEATAAHRNCKEFYIDQTVVGELREQATPDGKHGVLLLPQTAIQNAIPVEALADDAYTQFLFKDLAGQYGQFLKDADITEVPVYVVGADYARKQKQAFGRALWVGGLIPLDGKSDLLGDSVDPRNGGGRVCDVRRVERAMRDVPKETRISLTEKSGDMTNPNDLEVRVNVANRVNDACFSGMPIARAGDFRIRYMPDGRTVADVKVLNDNIIYCIGDSAKLFR